MGLSIKREDTERLARRVAASTGESLTDAIHHALEARAAEIFGSGKSEDQIKVEQAAFFAEIDRRGAGNGKSLTDLDAESYGEFGEPI